MDHLDAKARKDLALSEPIYYILTSLAEPRHGYGIMQTVAKVSDGQVRLAPGTLYGALTKLLEQGLIIRAGETEEGGERRKTYALTELGQRVIALELARLAVLVKLGHRTMEVLGGAK